VLVSVTPPRQLARSELGFPPPAPSGPVVEVGTLVGQLTVGASASTGQLRVHVSNPSSDDARPETFTVLAQLLADSGGESIALRLRPCGQGCFAAPTQLHAPGGKLLLTVASRGWTGGRTALDLPWPPVPAVAELHHALELLQATARVTLTEQVTSDTSRTAPIAVTLHDSGRQLLTTEPYGDGSGVKPVHLTAVGGLRRIGFAVASTYFVGLTLDTQGRIVAEQLVSPNHLISRTLAYPPTPPGR
jgi:copper transport protein